MPVNVESTPPPRIGKIGPYTVFITPPSTPSTPASGVGPVSDSPKKAAAPRPAVASPLASPPPVPSPVKSPAATAANPHPPPVQAPPSQFYSAKASGKSHSSSGFFWDAVAKVQNAHASLDEHVAYWFGLNQSKYQWALDDYYENKATDPSAAKAKSLSGKVQDV